MAEIEVLTVPALSTAVVRSRIGFPQLAATIKSSLDTVYAALPGLDLKPWGHNIVLYNGALMPGPGDVEIGILVPRSFHASGAVVPSLLPGGEVVRTLHRGHYSTMRQGYERLEAWLAVNGRRRAGPSWEEYGDIAHDAAPDKLETTLTILLAPA